MASQESTARTNHVIYVAIAADTVIAAAKFLAAGVTRSSAMLAEGIHSSVDAINSLLLLFGVRRSAKPADPSHPFGHARESYFWSLMVAMITFAIGGGVSIFEGIGRIRRGGSLENLIWTYVVLGISAVFGIVSTVDQLERTITQHFPDVKRIFLEAESLTGREKERAA
jgi:cation diffusion facilitator family transporter